MEIVPNVRHIALFIIASYRTANAMIEEALPPDVHTVRLDYFQGSNATDESATLRSTRPCSMIRGAMECKPYGPGYGATAATVSIDKRRKYSQRSHMAELAEQGRAQGPPGQ